MLGTFSQYLHNCRGQGTFLLGEVSHTGWWYYFPCVAAFKSTPAEMAIALGLVALAASRAVQSLRRWRGVQAALSAGLQPDWAVLFCWSAIVLFGAMMLGSRVQLGQRYLLPMYPMLYFLAADALWSLSVQCTGSGQTVSSARCAAVLRGPMPRVAAAVVLLTVQVASALAIAPHYLAYFSPIAGGPTAGYRLLADSNIDWGQDLPLLRAKLEQMGCRRALLRYSGTANPEASGVRTTPLDRSAIEEFFEFECLAVSVNDLSGYHRIVNPRLIAVAPFEPTARAGYSIFIFDLRVPKLRRSIGDRLERLCGDRPRSRAERNIEMR